MDIFEQAKRLEGAMTADRRHLHEQPEFGVCLPDTVAYVCSRLDEMGVSYRPAGVNVPQEMMELLKCAGYPETENTTGVLATIGSGSPCILLRADMDALKIKEETGLPYASKREGYGHMCGHDSHTAMLLGAAAILKEHEKELCGTVKLMFQPGEEWGAGAKLMIDDGILENPRVDAAVAIHIMSNVDAGKVCYCEGVTSSAMDTFLITIRGRGGHSSTPQLAIDPVNISNQLYTAINLLIGREADPAARITLTAGLARAGTMVNIIPDTAELHFALRSFDVKAREHIMERLSELIEHYVKAWRGEYSSIVLSTPSTVTDPAFLHEILPYIAEAAGEENVISGQPLGGTEDFSYVSQEVPSAFLLLGGGREGAYPMHNAKMTLDESVFKTGAAVFANCAINFLRNRAGKKA